MSFQKQKGEQRHFTGAMSSQATAWHHITGHTPESLIVKLNKALKTPNHIFHSGSLAPANSKFYDVAQRTVSLCCNDYRWRVLGAS